MPILPATSAVQDSDRRERVALVRTPSALCLGVGIVATVIGGFVAGGKGVLAGALGTLVVIAFFAGGPGGGMLLRTNPALGLNVALLVYVVQIGVLFLLLLVLKDATFFAPKIFAVTIVACALTWILAAVVGFSRSRTLYVEPGSGPPDPYGPAKPDKS
jgi:ATP synthase protein I